MNNDAAPTAKSLLILRALANCAIKATANDIERKGIHSIQAVRAEMRSATKAGLVAQEESQIMKIGHDADGEEFTSFASVPVFSLTEKGRAYLKSNWTSKMVRIYGDL